MSGKLFTGEQLDASLDQYYLRARYYNQGTGRFSQMDTYQGNNYDPITLHKYLYANVDPTTVIDPSGRFGITDLSAASSTRGILSTVATRGARFFKGITRFFKGRKRNKSPKYKIFVGSQTDISSFAIHEFIYVEKKGLNGKVTGFRYDIGGTPTMKANANRRPIASFGGALQKRTSNRTSIIRSGGRLSFVPVSSVSSVGLAAWEGAVAAEGFSPQGSCNIQYSILGNGTNCVRWTSKAASIAFGIGLFERLVGR